MTAIDGTEEGKRRLEEYQERANRSFAEHIEWQDKHRVPPTIRVPQEFRPLRDVETMRPIVEPHRPETRPHMPEEPGSGLPSGSGREERSTEPPRGDMTDYGWDDAGLPIEQPHSEDVEMEFVGAHTPRADIGILEPDSVDEESTQTLARIRCSAERAPTSHRKCSKPSRSLRQATSKELIVSEIYSPPRIIQLLREIRTRRSKQVKHLMPGFAFDLTTNDPDDGLPWDWHRIQERQSQSAPARADTVPADRISDVHRVRPVAKTERCEIDRQGCAGAHSRASHISHEIRSVALRRAGRRRTLLPPQTPPLRGFLGA